MTEIVGYKDYQEEMLRRLIINPFNMFLAMEKEQSSKEEEVFNKWQESRKELNTFH